MAFEMIKRLFYKKNMMPLYLVFGVTYDCNSFCRGCFSRKELRKNKKTELTLDEIERILSNLNNIPYVTLTGGEPFLRKDLPEICRLFYTLNKTKQITIPTNCLLPDRIAKITERILRLTNRRLVVNLSLDNLYDKHDYIRGVKGNFGKVAETYKKLARIKTDNLTINLHTVLSNQNKNDIKGLIEFCKQNFPAVSFHTFELLRGDVPDDMKPLTAEEYEAILPLLLDYWNTFSNYPKVIKAVKTQSCHTVLKILKQKTQVYPCYAGQVGCVIDPQGELFFCELLKSIGNLRDVGYDFKKLWLSQRANNRRWHIKNKKCYCTYLCFVNSSLPFSLKAHIGFILSNWRKIIKEAAFWLFIVLSFSYATYIFAHFSMIHHQVF